MRVGTHVAARIGVVILVGLFALTVVACSNSEGGRETGGSSSSAVPPDIEITDAIDLEHAPSASVEVDDSIWTSTSNSIEVIDLDTRQIIDSISQPAWTPSDEIRSAGPVGLAELDGTVWATLPSFDTVVSIDSETREVTGEVPVGVDPFNVVAGAGSVWVANVGDLSVSRIDQETQRVTNTVQLPGSVDSVNVGGGMNLALSSEGSVWVTNPWDGSLVRIDSESGSIVSTLQIGRYLGGIVLQDRTLWLTSSDIQGDPAPPEIVEIDAQTGEVVGTHVIRVTDLSVLGVIEASPGDLWVDGAPPDDTLNEPTRILRFDAETIELREIIELIAFDEIEYGVSDILAASDGAIWTTDRWNYRLYRLGADQSEPDTDENVDPASASDEALALFVTLVQQSCTASPDLSIPDPATASISVLDGDEYFVTDAEGTPLIVNVDSRTVYPVGGPTEAIPSNYGFGCDPAVFQGASGD